MIMLTKKHLLLRNYFFCQNCQIKYFPSVKSGAAPSQQYKEWYIYDSKHLNKAMFLLQGDETHNRQSREAEQKRGAVPISSWQ